MEDKSLQIAKSLAATQGYDYVKFEIEWRGYSVYFVCEKENLGSCCGYPNYVLVDGKNNARFAKFPNEVEAIMRAVPE